MGAEASGALVAIGFASAGASVAISSRKLPDLENVVKEVKEQDGEAIAVAAHAGKADDIEKLVGTVKEKYGKIDILFNNAGTNPKVVNMVDADERLWDTIMNLNLKGYFLLGTAVAKIMRDHGGGSIINCASIDAFRPEKYVGIYSVSKAGVLGLTRAWACDLAEFHIRANALCPGFIRTRLLESQFDVFPGKFAAIDKKIPLGRLGEPDDLVGACIFLASDASGYVTGHEIIVDGGLLIAE